MSEEIRVIQYGLGPIGNRVTQYLVERPEYEIVGGVDVAKDKVGRDVGELADVPAVGAVVSEDAVGLMKSVAADVVVLTTTSSLARIKEQVLDIVGCGLNVVTTCEELSYPWDTDAAASREIDEAAMAAGVSVLATGVNPGFLMDFLPLALTGVCRRVDSLRVERIQDAQFRRLPFQRKIGAGLTVEEFQKKVEEGSLRHVGLTESLSMIAAGLGWELDRTEETLAPVIAQERTEVRDMTVEPGGCLGVSQTGRGYLGDREVVTLIFEAAVGQPDPRDRVLIQGDPDIDSVIPGGVNGDVATCAIVVNAIPVTVRARPGLRTMADIEPVTCRR